jgi:drug/metabolite transporter (DMT)-like permease
LSWGLADYAGAFSTRRLGALRAVLGLQVTGAVLYALALLLVGRWPSLTVEQLPFALALAATGVGGVLLLYRGLALGPIAVVSPIGAAYVAVAVVLVVLVLGERLSSAQVLAIFVTFTGILLTATDGRSLASALRRPLPGVWFALLAMAALGAWSAVMAYAVRSQDGLALVLLQRIVSAAILLAILAIRREGAIAMDRTTWRLVLATGALDTLANVLFVLGVQRGSASVVTTATGAYPIVTALLAIVLLRERLAPNQYVGVAVLVAGLIALGLAG